MYELLKIHGLCIFFFRRSELCAYLAKHSPAWLSCFIVKEKSSLKNKNHIQGNKEYKNKTLNLLMPLILKYGIVNKNVISPVIPILMTRHCFKGSKKC